MIFKMNLIKFIYPSEISNITLVLVSDYVYIIIKTTNNVLAEKRYLAKLSESDSDTRNSENMVNGPKGKEKTKVTNNN